MDTSFLMLSLFCIPLLTFFGIVIAGKHENLREAVSLSASFLILLIVFLLYQSTAAIGFGEKLVLTSITPELKIAFKLEPLGMLFALIAGFLWFITTIYAIGYMRGNNEENQTRFYACFAIAISATFGIAFASNLFTLFIFYEVLTLSTFPLVTHKGNEQAMKSGRTYLGILISTSIGFLLPAIIAVWYFTGGTEFTPGGILAGHIEGISLSILAFLFLFGIGKAAVMPVHRWLPAAMVAPTPVSALLHAVAVVKAGVFSVLKIAIYIFGLETLKATPAHEWLLYFACFTVIMASVIALRQDNLKRRLAYSTISQLSYVVMATFILAPLSAVGAALHIAAHAFGKITLFFAAGSIYTASKKTEISQLNGIGRRMPITMTAFSIGALSMIGVPPAIGFISKWYILMGAAQAEQWLAVSVVVVSTLLNTGYFVPIIYAAFFKEEDVTSSKGDHKESPLAILVAISITATMTIALFFFPGIPFELATALPTGQ